MEKNKKLTGGKRALLIVGISLISIIALFLIALLCSYLFTPTVYGEFFDNARVEYEAPGLSDGFIPQGFAIAEEGNVYLQCGYMKNESQASRIYLTDVTSGESYYIELYTSDGKPYTGHTGGITTARNFVWIANDGEGEDNCVWVTTLENVLGCEKEGRLILKNKFRPETRAAYCFADEDYLWVGEFCNESYPTDESHSFEVSGGVNKALICAYALDDDSPLYGVIHSTVFDDESEEYRDVFVPELCLSVTDQIQGLAIDKSGRIILSASYGMARSHLLFYSPIDKSDPDAMLDFYENDVPVYYLDADSLQRDVEMPPMSEEIFVKGDRVFVCFESATTKYIFGNFTRGRHIYSFELE